MNKKYLLIIIILAIISISAVSAVSDENITSSADDEIIAVETQETQSLNSNDQILSINSNDEEIVNAGETGTFTELYNLINNAAEGSVIDLDKNYTYTSSGDFAQRYGITISKSITIDGHGYTLSGDNQVRILNLNSKNIVIKNVIFKDGNQKNGNNYDRGGAIYMTYSCGSIDIINSTFINNKATGYAGAIYDYYNDDGNIINCTFINNSGSSGGAIYSSGSDNHVISGSTFINNSVSNLGGSIYVYISSNSLINNSRFINSSASSDGNSIYIYSYEVIINNSTFLNNIGSGDEVYVKKEVTRVQINNSNFYGSKTPIYSEKSIDLNNNTLLGDSYIYIYF